MSSPHYDYQFLNSTLCGRQWQRIGTQRRAGVAVPLFSVYSGSSAGIGEIPDIRLLIDWCVNAGMSLLQLLPLNDVGYRFTPYDAESTFALEPAYLCLTDLEGVPAKSLDNDLQRLRRDFPLDGNPRVQYGIKKAKLEILAKVFDELNFVSSPGFSEFMTKAKFWIEDYALFKTLKEVSGQKSWEDWQDGLKNRDTQALAAFREEHQKRILFYQWLQYQLFRQFSQVREYARQRKVYLMGDLPFLVSRDSADVWANPEYFKLDLASGAPPDLYFAQGQRWGMPPYRWDVIAQHGYDYQIEKLRFAENFYDLYRIDHVVGIFRVWTIKLSEPLETHGYNGVFDPADENLWEEQGRKILSLMIEKADMLPCAEDLGVVPECAVRVLGEFGIPGMDVQRWRRDWGNTYNFLPPESYRLVSIALSSTHDMGGFKNWWEEETGTVDEERFKRSCAENSVSFDHLKEQLFEPVYIAGRLRWKPEIADEGKLLEILGLPQDRAWVFLDYYRSSFGEPGRFLNYLGNPALSETKLSSPGLVEAALAKVHESASIFSIQMFSDLLSLVPEIHAQADKLKVNWPGTFGEHNWSARMPLALEALAAHPVNHTLKRLHEQAGRL